jgi:serine/tyrosine/threonine adenylyltransferase
VQKAEWLHLNTKLARQLGLSPDELASDDGLAILAGNRVPEGTHPLSMAYAGHQFGGFSPLLGDGRAILLGEVRDGDGMLWDIQLKGAGLTPFSRPGSDGRAWLGPILREYVLSEAMHALGIPTTRALAAVSTGQPIRRERLYPGAILTRASQSHVRVGTFEYLVSRRDHEGLNVLTQFVLERHYPHRLPAENSALALLEEVMQRQAELVASWLSVGFIHGVMNTDNTSVIGTTIDYGPCAFLDVYDPQKVYSSIDHHGRYAYANQPRAAHWNVAVLANALLPILGPDGPTTAQEVIRRFPDTFAEAHLTRMRAKLGLVSSEDADGALAADLMTAMASGHADFTRTFRGLGGLGQTESAADETWVAEFQDPANARAWLTRWRARLGREATSEETRQGRMQQINPAYIPRNHRIEEMIQSAVAGELAPLHTLLDVLSAPFDARDAVADYALGPRPNQEVCQTFCGT